LNEKTSVNYNDNRNVDANHVNRERTWGWSSSDQSPKDPIKATVNFNINNNEEKRNLEIKFDNDWNIENMDAIKTALSWIDIATITEADFIAALITSGIDGSTAKKIADAIKAAAGQGKDWMKKP
jgi:hypothetical protein